MTVLSTIIERLEKRNPLPPLCPKEIWEEELSNEIGEILGKESTGQENPSELMLQAVKSGLLLWNDDLYASHTISQNISNEIGDYWHGIMHRREGDFSNAKYWYSKVGIHPIFQSLFEQACEVSPEIKSWGAWDPNRFIDEVERVVSNDLEDTVDGERLRKIQVLEMSLLLNYSLEV